MIDWLLPLLALLVLLALSAFFSCTETALFSLGKIQVRRLAQESPALGAVVNELLSTPRRLLATILFGNTLVNALATTLMLWLLLARLPAGVAAPVTILVMVALLVTVGELLPKLVAVSKPDRVARLTADAIHAFTHVIGPMMTVSQKLSEALLRLFVPASVKPVVGLSEEEVGTLLEVSLQEGVLREMEKNMIQEILRLRNRTAKDMLTPRVDMICVPATMPKAAMIAFLKKAGHRRVPVYDESPDTIVGILDVRKFLLSPEEEPIEIMDPPSFVPESMSAARLLKSFQTHKKPMAIVVDEFGGTEGLITVADILEEIIGDLAGEFRHPEQEIQQLAPNAWLIRGETRIDDVNEQLGLRLELPGVETISGLATTRLGGIPRPGAYIQLGDVRLTVQRVAKNRIVELRLERPAAENA